MGQHKYNQTAIAASKGELPPKQKPVGKRELEYIMYNLVVGKMVEMNPALAAVCCAMTNKHYGDKGNFYWR